MEIVSPIHGMIKYEEADIVLFKKGIPGFESLKKFVLKEIENEPYWILQSIDEKELAFIIMSPFIVDEKYEMNLDKETIKRLSISKPEDVALYSIITLSSDSKKITMNLKAPLVINIDSKIGEQIIRDDDKYKIKHPLC